MIEYEKEKRIDNRFLGRNSLLEPLGNHSWLHGW